MCHVKTEYFLNLSLRNVFRKQTWKREYQYRHLGLGILFSPWQFRKLSLRAWPELWNSSPSQLLFKKPKDHKKFVVCVSVDLTLPLLISTDAVCLNLQSAPVSVNARGVCSRDGAGKGKGSCSAVQHSPYRSIQSVCCTAWSLGGAMVPLTSVPLGNHLHECCLQLLWAVDGRRLVILLLQKEKTFYLSQSSPLLHMLLSAVRRGAS